MQPRGLCGTTRLVYSAPRERAVTAVTSMLVAARGGGGRGALALGNRTRTQNLSECVYLPRVTRSGAFSLDGESLRINFSFLCTQHPRVLTIYHIPVNLMGVAGAAHTPLGSTQL